MPFTFDLTDNLRETLEKLAKKDPRRSQIIRRKIQEIIGSDGDAIDHYKNLRYDLSDCKRVHIDRSFVLVFRVFKKERHVLFVKFDHHDRVYRR